LNPILRLCVSRLVQLPLIVGVIYTVTLILAWAVPGDPLEGPEARRPPAEVRQQMRVQYNLDSFGSFYRSYLASATGWKWVDTTLGLTQEGRERRADWQRQDEAALASGVPTPSRRVFDLGPSLQYRDRRVNEIIAESLPVSMTLGLCAIVLATVLGVGAGVIGAVKPGSLLDALTLLLSLIGISMPTFVIGTVLLLTFSVWWPLLPVGEWGTLRALILPSLTLSLGFAAYIARLTRLGMMQEMQSDYVRTARAKGLSERDVVLRHALKNAFLPVLSYLGPATALAMTGSFVVERVFKVPGLGQHFVNAVQNKDLFLIIGVVLVYSTMLIVFNLIVDVLYRWVDPRIA
jgi:oligopeptide transport system permease protein